jgi:hypothetical protein
VGAPFKFAPAEGPDFFRSHGWTPAQVEGLLHTAARFGRPPLLLRLFAKVADVRSWKANRPWAGVCLLERNSSLKDGKGKTS